MNGDGVNKGNERETERARETERQRIKSSDGLLYLLNSLVP